MLPGRKISCFLIFSMLLAPVLAAPTVPTDVEQPGTQPGEVPSYTSPSNCDNCHAGTPNPDFEPFFGWEGSMMAHSSRDPLFWAALAIAEQDFLPNADPDQRGGAGDFCLRCHMPAGWLAGRSTPTDGSGMISGTDSHGVECEHCHLLVNPDPPVNVVGTVEEQTAPYVANDGTEAFRGSGMYVVNSEGSRLGPYSDPTAPHDWKQSEFHRQSEMCGTCHDVSNPVVGDLAHNFGAQLPLQAGTYSGTLGGPVADKAAFNNSPYAYGIVERTYSEWAKSGLATLRVDQFTTLPAALQTPGGSLEVAYGRAWNGSTANYADGTRRYFTCQTCHMSASTGKGCKQPSAPTRTDLPRHDLTGSGYWVPELIQYQDDQGTLRFGGPVSASTRAAMDAGMLRAEAMLKSAALLEATDAGSGLDVRITNLSGHKLITGYPEGRRMWLNVKWLDSEGATIGEEGAYGPIGRTATDLSLGPHPVQSILDLDNTVIIQAKPAMDQQWASQLIGFGLAPTMTLTYDRMMDVPVESLATLAAQAPGSATTTFHFVLNNVLKADNRIPPYGMAYDDALERNMLPVPDTQYGNPGPGGTFDYFFDTSFTPPPGAATAEVRLLFQQTSWEYVQFLWLQNDQQNTFLGQEGVNLLDAWLNTGQSPPLEMALAVVELSGTVAAPGEASRKAQPAEHLLAGQNSGNGQIEISYTAACDATDHTVYYGPLSAVSTYAYSGAECGVGNTGSAAFDPGTGDTFFVVVGNNGSVEGSYGLDGQGGQRPEDVGTAVCDVLQDLSGTCDLP